MNWIQGKKLQYASEWKCICEILQFFLYIEPLIDIVFAYYIKCRFNGIINENAGKLWTYHPRQYFYAIANFSSNWTAPLSAASCFIHEVPVFAHYECVKNWEKKFIVPLKSILINKLNYDHQDQILILAGRWKKRDSLFIVNLQKYSRCMFDLKREEKWFEADLISFDLDWTTAIILNSWIFFYKNETMSTSTSPYSHLLIFDIFKGQKLFCFQSSILDFVCMSQFYILRDPKDNNNLEVFSWQGELKHISTISIGTSCICSHLTELGLIIIYPFLVTLYDSVTCELLCQWKISFCLKRKRYNLGISTKNIMIFNLDESKMLVLN